MVESGGGLSALWSLLLILAGIGVLGLVGWLVWILTRESRSHARAVDAVTQEARSSNLASQGRMGGEPALTYFLGLRRSPATGDWEIHVQGQPYASLEDVPDQQVQGQVVSALRALADFSRAYVRKQKSPEGAATESSGAPSTRSQAPPPIPEAHPARLGEGASPASPSREPAWRSSTSPSTIPTVDLAQEIGDIVEEMLSQEPSLDGHAVRLMNAPAGGVNFLVDGVIYRDLSEIPNQDIRSLIQRATKEWERR
ncbi:MAG: hypothetical protein ACP5JG_02710 [Anaerolineae bacterium]